MPRPTGQERLELNVCPEPNTGCWLWCGVGNELGYGFMIDKGKRWKTHRYSWTIYRGPIPDGMLVLHKCDTPRCVNPDHFFLGTQQDNMSDCKAKGRNKPSGRHETHPKAKLSFAKAAEIRQKIKEGYGVRELGRMYGVTHPQIIKVRDAKRWVA